MLLRFTAADTEDEPQHLRSSVETLDELQDWLIAQNPQLIAELREAGRQDLAAEFKPWQPPHVPWPTASK